jgi:hypothetical protein
MDAHEPGQGTAARGPCQRRRRLSRSYATFVNQKNVYVKQGFTAEATSTDARRTPARGGADEDAVEAPRRSPPPPLSASGSARREDVERERVVALRHGRELSRLESRADHRVSSLRRYVEALGGEIEITAIIGTRRVKLTDV